MMADKYVPIFFDWPEATQELKAQEKGRLIDAIVIYARGGDWSELLEGNERYVFPMFQLQVDRAKQISSVRAAARTNNNKTEQNEQTATKPLTRTNTNTNTNTKTTTKESETRAARFTPPTVDEVRAYALEKGWTSEQFDPERFVDFYASKGWKVGRDPMKDWKASARGWVSRDKPTGKPKEWHNPALDYTQRDYSHDAKPERIRVLNMETGEWEWRDKT